MNDEIKNILEEQFKKVPKRVQSVLLSAEFRKKIRNVGTAHQLTFQQLGKLEDETVLVLLGLEPMAEYPENVEKEVGVKENIAQTITTDILNNVIEPVKQDLGIFLTQQLKEDEDQIKNGVQTSTMPKSTEKASTLKQKMEGGERENVEEKGAEQILRAGKILEKAQQKVQETDEVREAIKSLLGGAERHLVSAKQAFEQEQYGEAFGQARAAEVAARNALRALETRSWSWFICILFSRGFCCLELCSHQYQ